MGYAALKLVHLLAVVVWVGGMAFVQLALRPALSTLPPPQRLVLMNAVLGRFFGAVTVAVVAALASGAWMWADVHQRVADTGGQLRLPPGWALMAALGVLMAGVFVLIRWRLYPRLQLAVAREEWPVAGQALARIRLWVTVNLVIGLGVIVAAVLGGA
jgi:uncharacterized membrane protein